MVHPTVKKSEEQNELNRVGMHLHGEDLEEESGMGHEDFKGWGRASSFQGFNQEKDNKGSESESIKMSKDEKLAREAGVRFSIDQIVGLPMDEFNDLLSKQDLTEEQLNLCRDIRRRGKNKVAAQNCRKRKIDQVEELQIRYQESREQGKKLALIHKQAKSEYNEVASEVSNLMDRILVHENLDPRTHTIVRNANGELSITKKTSPNSEPQGSLRPVPVEKLNQPGRSNVQYHNNHNNHNNHNFFNKF